MSILWSEKLNKDTYLIYAARNYKSLSYTWTEFFSDIKSFYKLNKLFLNYNQNKCGIEQILNQFISLGNLFIGISFSRLCFYIIEEQYHSYVKTILHFIHRMPYIIPEYNKNISLNTEMLKQLNLI